MPGLLKGYIDRFAPEENAHDFSFDGWLQVCANACVLVHLQRSVVQSEAPRPDVRGNLASEVLRSGGLSPGILSPGDPRATAEEDERHSEVGANGS